MKTEKIKTHLFTEEVETMLKEIQLNLLNEKKVKVYQNISHTITNLKKGSTTYLKVLETNEAVERIYNKINNKPVENNNTLNLIKFEEACRILQITRYKGRKLIQDGVLNIVGITKGGQRLVSKAEVIDLKSKMIIE